MWLLEVELIASTSSEDVSSALEARPSTGCCSPLQVACPSAVKEPWLQIQKLANAGAGTHCKDNWKIDVPQQS